MKKVAIVGVEGSGKTVMLAGLGELYSQPDENGNFLSPKNFATASYVADKIARMRGGKWPTATAEDVLQGLDWTLKHKSPKGERPEGLCEISCLDFAGEVYRNAFGINAESGTIASNEATALKNYIRAADAVIVLINLRDIIVKGVRDPRVQEAIWITRSILQYALDDAPKGREPRVALALTQADSYAGTIESCGGVWGVLKTYLRDVANNYDWLDAFEVSAVDRTRLDDNGNVIPDEDFSLDGLKPIVDWILKDERVAAKFQEEPLLQTEHRPRRRLKISAISACAFIAISAVIIFFVSSVCDQSYMADKYYKRAVASRDRDEAVKLYRKAAELGHAEAQYNLGECYYIGYGVQQDYTEAVKWYRKAAEQGNARAQDKLGECYYTGNGVSKDVEEAVKWHLKSTEQGNNRAKKNLDAMKAK